MFILSFGGIILLAFFLTRLAAFAKVEITLSENSISIKWLQQFLFANKPDVAISFKEIAEYVPQGDSNWDWLKIKLKDETVYRIWHSSYLSKDDYDKFISAFTFAVENYNKSSEASVSKDESTPTSNIIHRSKTIYETTWGLILGGISIIIIVGLPILLFVFPPNKTPNYGIFGLGYAGAIYFVIQVYLYRKKNNDKNL